MTLKKISTPIRFQALTQDPNYPSYLTFSDGDSSNPRQFTLPAGTYIFILGGGANGVHLQYKNSSGEWIRSEPGTGTASIFSFTLDTGATLMARCGSDPIGDLKMVIIAPPN